MEISGIQFPSVAGVGQVMGPLGSPAGQRTGQADRIGAGAFTPETQNPGHTFDAFLQAILDNFNETNQDIQAQQQIQLDIATGMSDDILGMTLAMERATASLNFTIQVTNRLLEAYREIMRMQI